MGINTTDEDDGGRKKERVEGDKEQTKDKNKVCNIYSRLSCGQSLIGCACERCEPLTRNTDH